MANLIHKVSILAMDETVLLGMLDKTALAKAKKHAGKDTIEIKVFGFASEGFHTFGGPGGIGKVSQVWNRDSVYSAHKALRMETPLFFGHSPKPISEREPYGFVIGKDIQVIDDREQAIVAVYIHPKYEKERLDVVSIEAATDIIMQNGTQYVVEVSEISAIAVGNSELMSPAFDTATLKAKIAAFAAQTQEKEVKKMADELSPGEIRSAIRKLGLTVFDLFSRKELQEDESVKEILSNKEAEIAKKYEKEKSEIESKVQEYEKRVGELSGKASYSEFSKRLAKITKDRKLDETQQKFLSSKAENLVINDFAKADSEIDQFVEDSLGEYEKTAALFGKKTENKENEGEGSDDGKGIATPPNTKKEEKDNFLL